MWQWRKSLPPQEQLCPLLVSFLLVFISILKVLLIWSFVRWHIHRVLHSRIEPEAMWSQYKLLYCMFIPGLLLVNQVSYAGSIPGWDNPFHVYLPSTHKIGAKTMNRNTLTLLKFMRLHLSIPVRLDLSLQGILDKSFSAWLVSDTG